MKHENESPEDYKLRVKLEKIRYRNLIKSLDNLFDIGNDEEHEDEDEPNTFNK